MCILLFRLLNLLHVISCEVKVKQKSKVLKFVFNLYAGVFGVQFPGNNSAFSAVTLFQTIGFISGFVCSVFFCTNIKTYIYLGISFTSFLTYGGLGIKNSYLELKEANIKNAVKAEALLEGNE